MRESNTGVTQELSIAIEHDQNRIPLRLAPFCSLHKEPIVTEKSNPNWARFRVKVARMTGE